MLYWKYQNYSLFLELIVLLKSVLYFLSGGNCLVGNKSSTKVFSLFLLEITLLKQKLFLLHCQVYILYLIFGDNYPAKSVIEFALLKIKVWGGNPTPIHEAICHIPRSTPFYLCKIKSIVPELANQDIFRKKLSTFLWTPIFQLWFC